MVWWEVAQPNTYCSLFIQLITLHDVLDWRKAPLTIEKQLSPMNKKRQANWKGNQGREKEFETYIVQRYPATRCCGPFR
jgi:hypothetical protein